MVSTVSGYEESEHRTKFPSGVFWISKGVVNAGAKQTGAWRNLQEYQGNLIYQSHLTSGIIILASKIEDFMLEMSWLSGLWMHGIIICVGAEKRCKHKTIN